MPNETAEKKLKELKEAYSLVEDLEDRVIWACDFTSFPAIAYLLNPIADTAGEIREKLESEISHLEDQLNEYQLKLEEFEFDNAIPV